MTTNPITKLRWRKLGVDAVIDMAVHLERDNHRLRAENEKLRGKLRRQTGESDE